MRCTACARSRQQPAVIPCHHSVPTPARRKGMLPLQPHTCSTGHRRGLVQATHMFTASCVTPARRARSTPWTKQSDAGVGRGRAPSADAGGCRRPALSGGPGSGGGAAAGGSRSRRGMDMCARLFCTAATSTRCSRDSIALSSLACRPPAAAGDVASSPALASPL